MDSGIFTIIFLMLGAIIALLVGIGRLLESSNKLLASINAKVLDS